MGKIKAWLYRTLYGRYGNDSFNNFMTVTAIVMMFAGVIIRLIIGNNTAGKVFYIVWNLLIWLIIGFTVFRTFSKNIYARRKENDRFVRFKSFFKFNKVNKSKLPKDTNDHVFRKCPKCSSVLRLPREKGSHDVRCPRCQNLFSVRVK